MEGASLLGVYVCRPIVACLLSLEGRVRKDGYKGELVQDSSLANAEEQVDALGGA